MNRGQNQEHDELNGRGEFSNDRRPGLHASNYQQEHHAGPLPARTAQAFQPVSQTEEFPRCDSCKVRRSDCACAKARYCEEARNQKFRHQSLKGHVASGGHTSPVEFSRTGCSKENFQLTSKKAASFSIEFRLSNLQ
jgi:hypothetical protein